MRATAAFSRLLDLPGVRVREVCFEPDRVLVHVALRRRRLICPKCGYSTMAREEIQDHDSSWRHLDLGRWPLVICAKLRTLRCPVHGVHVEGVPFARHRARFTGDFEDLVAWLATRTDKSTIGRLVRVDWQTVGRIIDRVAAEHLNPGRLNGLFEISLDEVAWRKGHRYLTLVGDHDRGCVLWGTEGKGQAAADAFFAELDPEHHQLAQFAEQVQQELGIDLLEGEPFPPGPRASQLRAVSMDMTGGYAKSVCTHAPQAEIVIDNFHVVQLATKALDEVRRERWNELRAAGEPKAAQAFKHARWALLKNPEDLTEQQAQALAELHSAGGPMPRAWGMKEMVREIFKTGLNVDTVDGLIDRLLARLSRSRLPPFVRLSRTIRKHRQGILAARRLGLSNARAEALNNTVKLIVRRAYGFHSARAALALIHLACGPVTLTLPHER